MTASSRFVIAALATVFAIRGSPLAAQCSRNPSMTVSAAGPDVQRPRVGLVLGGGGARGAAHVGVLQVLEELSVPVDFLVGTSMGAVVGGLYAAGVSPDSMEGWLRRADWDDLFRDEPRYSELSFRRKADARAFPMPLVVGAGANGLQLPTGLVAGQKLNLALRSLTFRAARVSDFDSLAVPFRAVATDLETGTLAVFARGDLVDAMRASMSVPGVFTPYPVDERLYVDGGLLQNLPVEVACALGADVIIAVDVGSRLVDRSELRSVLDITSQVTRVVTRSGSDVELGRLGPSDIVIQPDLGDISSTDFGRSLDAVAAGRAAARAAGEKLAGLAPDTEAFRRARERRVTFGKPPGNVDFVVVGRYSGRSPGNLARRLATRPGPLDTAAVNRDIEHLYNLGIYERVDYRIVETEEGDALMLRVREKPWGPWYMRFRLSISDRIGSEGTYSLATQLLIPQVNDWGAELVTGLEIGARGSLAAEFYQPLGTGSRFFLAPWFWFQSTPVDIVVGERPVARYRTAFTAVGLRAGIHPGSDTEIAVGIERGDLNGKPAIGTTSLEGFTARTGIVRLTVDVDGLDDPLFPRSGVGLAFDVLAARRALGSTDTYDRADAMLVGAASFGRTTVLGTVLAASSLNSTLPGHAMLGLGGFLLMSGYRPGELSGNHLAFGRLSVSRELGTDQVQVGLSYEVGNVWQDRSAIDLADLRTSLATTLGLRTLLGPVYLGVGTRGAGRPYFYLEVGRAL